MPAIIISEHAQDQMAERGATEAEVELAIAASESEPASKGRLMYRKNFEFNARWRGRDYSIKQVAPVVARDGDTLIVVTVYVFYF